jgi:hypothetical protein
MSGPHNEYEEINMIKEFYIRWKARRALKKAIPVLEKICSEAPASMFKDLFRDRYGRDLDHIEARNTLSAAVQRMKVFLR